REDADRGGHDLELVLAELVDGQDGLVLPREEHVAYAALDERGGRSARAGVEHGYPLVQLGHEGAGLRLIAAGLLQRVAPGREVVPPRSARGLGVCGDDRDAWFEQVGPVLDALRVAFAHDEYDRRRIRRAVLGKPFLPAGRDEAAFLDGVDVVGQGQRDDVGLEAVDDRSGLLARAAMRLVDGDRLARLLLVARDERGVDRLVQLARRVVGDIQQRRVLRPRGGRGADGRDQGGEDGDAGGGVDL